MLSNHEITQLQYEARKRNAMIRHVLVNPETKEVREARYMTPGNVKTVNYRSRLRGSPWRWVVQPEGNGPHMVDPEPIETVARVEKLLALAKITYRPNPTDLSSASYSQSRLYNAWLYSVKD